jgi:hypothetical protein
LDRHSDAVAPPSGEVVVFANGTTPDGDPFEVIAYKTRELKGTRAAGPATPKRRSLAICVSLGFPHGGPGDLGVSCYRGRPTEGEVHLSGVSSPPRGSDPHKLVTVTGEANAKTRRVLVTYEERSGNRRVVPATVAFVGGKLGQRIGVTSVTEPTVHFFAFLTGVGSYRRVEAVALDAEGNELGTNTVRPDPGAVRQRRAFERFREQVERHCRGVKLEQARPEETPRECERMLERGPTPP